jgi:hypothetical protein
MTTSGVGRWQPLLEDRRPDAPNAQAGVRRDRDYWSCVRRLNALGGRKQGGLFTKLQRSMRCCLSKQYLASRHPRRS